MSERHGPLLVATDFSDGAAGALREARAVALPLGAEVLVLHVAGAAVWQPDASVSAWLAAAGVEPGGVVLRFGSPWAQIVRHALDVGASMIVVGSHGRTGFHPLSPGSTSAQLLTRSPVPVLVVTPESGRTAATAAHPGELPGHPDPT